MDREVRHPSIKNVYSLYLTLNQGSSQYTRCMNLRILGISVGQNFFHLLSGSQICYRCWIYQKIDHWINQMLLSMRKWHVEIIYCVLGQYYYINKYMPCLEWFLSLVIGLDIEEKSHINFRICFFPHVRPESILRNGTLRG